MISPVNSISGVVFHPIASLNPAVFLDNTFLVKRVKKIGEEDVNKRKREYIPLINPLQILPCEWCGRFFAHETFCPNFLTINNNLIDFSEAFLDQEKGGISNFVRRELKNASEKLESLLSDQCKGISGKIKVRPLIIPEGELHLIQKTNAFIESFEIQKSVFELTPDDFPKNFFTHGTRLVYTGSRILIYNTHLSPIEEKIKNGLNYLLPTAAQAAFTCITGGNVTIGIIAGFVCHLLNPGDIAVKFAREIKELSFYSEDVFFIDNHSNSKKLKFIQKKSLKNLFDTKI